VYTTNKEAYVGGRGLLRNTRGRREGGVRVGWYVRDKQANGRSRVGKGVWRGVYSNPLF
jgi:hypothetical protein